MPGIKNRFRTPRSIAELHFKKLYPNFKGIIRQRSPYWENGRKFLQNFRSCFYKVRGKTYLIDLKQTDYEAPFAVSISARVKGKEDPFPGTKNRKLKDREKVIFQASVSFRKNGVVIETFQGNVGVSGEIRAFESAAQMPAANFLCSTIEDEAKRLGYKYVYIKRPETNPWFKDPMLSDELRKIPGIKKFAGTRVTSKSEKVEYKRLETIAANRIRTRMKKMIDGVANSRNYKPFKRFYRTELV